jgi:hypothetical protein
MLREIFFVQPALRKDLQCFRVIQDWVRFGDRYPRGLFGGGVENAGPGRGVKRESEAIMRQAKWIKAEMKGIGMGGGLYMSHSVAISRV